MGNWRGLVLAGAVVALPGCFSAPPGSAERLAQIEREGVELQRAADAVEEKLLGNQAMMHTWEELGRRHRQVSAIVVRNQLEHFDDMVLHMEQQQEKARLLKRRHVAEAEGDGDGDGRGAVLTRAAGPQSAKARRN